jgi:hypothetical protein
LTAALPPGQPRRMEAPALPSLAGLSGLGHSEEFLFRLGAKGLKVTSMRGEPVESRVAGQEGPARVEL